MRSSLIAAALAAAVAASALSAGPASATGAGSPQREAALAWMRTHVDHGALALAADGAAPDAPAATPYQTSRLAGADRYETAALISRYTFPDPAKNFGKVVFIASGANFPDALAGGPAAVSAAGPVLLVRPTGSIPSATAAELKRLRPTDAVILGGPSAVPASVVGALRLYGVDYIDRIQGANRYDTAAQLTYFVSGYDSKTDELIPPDTVYVASGETFADALAGSAAAAYERAPLVLTESASLPASTKGSLLETDSLGKPLYRTVRILGGWQAVSTQVEAEIRSLLPNAVITRYAGDNRYATADAINRAVFHSFQTARLATGEDFPDALVSAPSVLRAQGPTVLTPPSCLSRDAARTIAALDPSEVIAIGGPQVVSDAALQGSLC